MKILIVDDNEDIRLVLGLMLKEQMDLELFEAGNGCDAIKMFIKELPNLVIMDIVMPGKDGIEATKIILEKFPDARIIGHTAYSSIKGEAMLREGALEIMSKPIKKKDLLHTISRYFNAAGA